MALTRRIFLTAAVVGKALLALRSIELLRTNVLRPEDFGALGDGSTNDTSAFGALSQEVNRRGGGTIHLAKGKTYIVGRQMRNQARYFLSPSPIIHLEKLRFPLRIIGNGARLLAEPGLRFGVFDENSLLPLKSVQPNFRPNGISAPYDAMISISECLAPVEVMGIELDGNIARMSIGGGYGDTGHQLPGSGLILTGNRSGERISGVYSHHHPLDGIIINGAEDRLGRSAITNLVSRHNGRQALSLVGGRGYDLVDCEFGHTGRSVISSAPGAGVDIEAESKSVRDVRFLRCRFIDNFGPGLLADQGDTEGITCTSCTFIGTTSWAAWPNKPRIQFLDCTFVGAVSNAFSSRDPGLATQFKRCGFRDDPSLAPGGRVFFNDRSGGGPIVDLGGSGGTNVLFSQCIFDLTRRGRLPWTTQAIYSDNLMSQKSPETAYPRGRYLGRNVIHGAVDLYSSAISGDLFVNGRKIS